MTMAQRLRWHYEVAKMKGAPLTERDVHRLDDVEFLIEGGEGGHDDDNG